MKLLFLTGCAEPGRDGVGDYTAILAEQCQKQGHECRIASIHDPYILDEPEITATTWRFSNALERKEERFSLQKLCEEFSPDWVSLQFVPYGFHPKGLPWSLGKTLSQIAPQAHLHIMFHETWTGPHLHASLKDKFYGFLQQRILKNLLRKRPPQCVHTHACPYIHLLKKLGLQAKQLPLPSNIPIAQQNADAWLWRELSDQGITINKNTRRDYLLLGIFGSLYPVWPTEAFCSKIKSLALAQAKKCILISVGHIGAGAATWKNMIRETDEHLTIISLGCLKAEKVSEVLQSLDLGVAALPWSLIEKGSSIATLLAHGLPVLVPRDDIHFNFRAPISDPRLIKMSLSTQEILSQVKKSPPHDPVMSVAKQFLSDLSKQ